jgi:hypothetical protein
MAILGGSPLGLIGNQSSPVRETGMSTFNGGSSRNINVNEYNTSKGDKGTKSVFSGSYTISPYGNTDKIGTDNGGGLDITGNDDRKLNRSNLHNNTIYDISLLNIIEQLSKTAAAIRPSDFAYLKDVGVYPNNRLMIARRFLSPHGDNIYCKAKASSLPMAVMISWKAETDDFLEISFGEKWEDAKADFTSVLNELGEDFTAKVSSGLGVGDIMGSLGGAIPLPGFSEILQRKVLERLGILAPGASDNPLPSGNPNLIKEAKRRKTIPFSDPGSGLKCSVSVKMTCVWEQKFISGLDPTIVWQDILTSVLKFGTSKSNNYGLSNGFQATIDRWLNDPSKIVSDMITYITEALVTVKEDIIKMVKGALELLKPADDKEETPEAVAAENADKEKKISDAIDGVSAEVGKLIDELKADLAKQIQKYKVEIEGIARALSGAPSTPWHITIGNPMRPVFSAGDMYMSEDVNLKLGPTLAFNDLPSTITAEFTLTNARPWGLQEILAKFNSGSLRVTNGLKDSNSLNPGESLGVQDTKSKVKEPIGLSASGPSASNVNSVQSSSDKVTKDAAIKVPIDKKDTVVTTDISSADKNLQARKQETPLTLNPAGLVSGEVIVNNSSTLKNASVAVTENTVSNVSGLTTTKVGEVNASTINPDAANPIVMTTIDISKQDIQRTT